MKIINFTEGQNSEEWRVWRKGGIGASDISIILGSNTYTTPLKLWEIKCGYGEDEVINRAMMHGITHEDMARKWINEAFQLNVKPLCIEDNEKSYYRASLDGWDFDSQTLVEIKCPISESILDKARITQAIPDYWFDQVQWQIMLSNPKRAFIAIWDYRYNSCITLDMFGIPSRMEKMREKADEFWHKVQIGKPPEMMKGDFVHVEDEVLKQLLLEYQELCEKEQGISLRKKELKEEIERFGKNRNFIAYGFKVQKIAPRTSYDIEKMRMDGIDVESYVKKSEGTASYRILFPKKYKGVSDE